MPLINIEYGSLASSSDLNSNFQYLDDRISTAVQNNTAAIATVNSNIATLNSSLSTFSEGTNNSISAIEDSITGLSGIISSNGLYLTTYVNGTSWYRVWFSDSDKTNRVWVEQGGIAQTQSTTSLLVTMSDSNYTLVLGRRAAYMEAEAQEGTRTASSFYLKNGTGYVYPVDYYVCGK